jgi:hypothetical protein
MRRICSLVILFLRHQKNVPFCKKYLLFFRKEKREGKEEKERFKFSKGKIGKKRMRRRSCKPSWTIF